MLHKKQKQFVEKEIEGLIGLSQDKIVEIGLHMILGELKQEKESAALASCVTLISHLLKNK